jgi:hypothetical protein
MGSPSIVGDARQLPRRERRSSSLAEYRPRFRGMTVELCVQNGRKPRSRHAVCNLPYRPVTFAREALLCARLGWRS